MAARVPTPVLKIMLKDNLHTGGVALHNIERARFLPPIKIIMR